MTPAPDAILECWTCARKNCSHVAGPYCQKPSHLIPVRVPPELRHVHAGHDLRPEPAAPRRKW